MFSVFVVYVYSTTTTQIRRSTVFRRVLDDTFLHLLLQFWFFVNLCHIKVV